MSTFTIDTATSRATPTPVPGKRMTAPALRARKVDGKTEQPIVALTAYTMRLAQLLDEHCDLLLVGDSLGQVGNGFCEFRPSARPLVPCHSLREAGRTIAVKLTQQCGELAGIAWRKQHTRFPVGHCVDQSPHAAGDDWLVEVVRQRNYGAA